MKLTTRELHVIIEALHDRQHRIAKDLRGKLSQYDRNLLEVSEGIVRRLIDKCERLAATEG